MNACVCVANDVVTGLRGHRVLTAGRCFIALNGTHLGWDRVSFIGRVDGTLSLSLSPFFRPS